MSTTLKQIGAVIGIQGAREYMSDMKDLATITKSFESATKELTSSFDKNNTSIKQVKSLEASMKTQRAALVNELNRENQALKQINDNMTKGKTLTLEQEAGLAKIQGDISDTTAKINELDQAIKDLPSTARLIMDAWNNGTSDWGELFKGVGGALTKYVTTPLVAGAGVAVKTAIDYQSAFTGVKKTVDENIDANGKIVYSYEQLNDELKKIPLRTASSYQTVAAVAEAAGQLGINIEEIPKYAEAVIMLGDSTNISAEEASTAIAQFMNIVGDSTDSVDKFGGSLVALGNNTATDEASILRLATRLASAGHLVGLSTPQILGLSAAMSSVGLTAEAGGTAMSQAMTKISKAVAEGGSSLELFGEVTGRTGQEFANLWRNDPINAIEEFLIGLSNLEGGSEALILMLDELGFKGIRESDTLRRLASDYDGVSDAVRLAEKNYKGYDLELGTSNALSEEASKRYETWQSQISQLKEALLQLADEIGKDLVPDLISLVDGAKELIQKWKELSPETKRFWIDLLKVVAVIGPLLTAFGNLMITMAKFKEVIAVLNGANGVGGLTKALGGGDGLSGALDTATTAAGNLAGEAGLGSLMASLGQTMGIVGLYGALMYAVLGSDEKKTKEWARELEKDIGGVNQDWDTYGQTVSTTLDETGAYIDTYAQANSKLMKDKSGETTRKVKEDLIDLKKGVRDNLNEARDIAKYDFQQAQQSASSSSLKAKQDVTMSFNEMSGEVTLTAGQIAKKVPEEFKNMTRGVSTEGENTKRAYKMVLTGIEGTPTPDLYTAGQHMMDSMTRGINGHSWGPINAAAGVAARIASYLMFSEPEKGALSNFHTAMPDMMKLMAQGINQNMYLVEDALDNVSSMMASNFENGGNNVSYGGVTINLNVPQGTDGRSLVDQIETEIANRTMRRRMVFN